jgi:hypothetical protein
MATTQQSNPAEITVPAAYLEDVRSAVVAEIVNDSDMLRDNHQSVVDGQFGGDTEDRTSAAATLHRAMGVLDQVLHAAGDTTIEAEGADISFVLEKMVRLLAARLDHEKQYGPINMGAVLDLAVEMHWAAEEAIRIDPRVDERKWEAPDDFGDDDEVAS